MTTYIKYLAAVGRVENFLANYERAQGVHPEEIYQMHSIPDGEPGVIRVSDLRALLEEIRTLTDSEDSRAVVLDAENNRLKARLAELENAVNWDTTCLSCSTLLDKLYARDAQAERDKPVLDAAADAVAEIKTLRVALSEKARALVLAVDARSADPSRETEPTGEPSLSVSCPACGSPAGVWCFKGMWGHVVGHIHAVRRRAVDAPAGDA